MLKELAERWHRDGQKWTGLDVGDLSGEEAAHRPLQLEHLDLLLDTAEYLITKSNDDFGRDTAARALGILGHRFAIPALLAVFRDEEEDIRLRKRCLVALSAIGDKRVVTFLIAALDNDSRAIAILAQNQLMKITGLYLTVTADDPDHPSRRKLQDAWRSWWQKNGKRVRLRSDHAFNSEAIDLVTPEDWSPPPAQAEKADVKPGADCGKPR